MVVHRGRYEKQDVVDALEIVRNGEMYTMLARMSSDQLRTLFRKAKVQKRRIPLERMTRGMNPAIEAELESHLVEWMPPCSA